MNDKILRLIAYLGSLALLMYIFGVGRGILTLLALMLFGWGMNLENANWRLKR